MAKIRYWKKDYAALKNVAGSYVSQLIKSGKLKTGTMGGRQCVLDCKENDKLFERPKSNSKRAKIQLDEK